MQNVSVVYREYRDDLQEYVDRCNTVLREVQKVIDNLTNLEKQHVFVSTQTRALHDACEQSLHDQVGISSSRFMLPMHIKLFRAWAFTENALFVKHKIYNTLIEASHL